MAPPPDDYGWAYIDPQRATASADGPSGSLQFRWGSEDLVPGQFSGSEDLVFYAATDGHKSTPDASGSALYLYGSMYVSGAIHAETYTIRQVTSTEIDVSGSTKFGDSSDDTHQRSGSLEVSGPSNFTSEINAESNLTVSGNLRTHAHTFLGNALADVTTFYGTVTGSQDANAAGSDVHANRFIGNDLSISGSTTLGDALTDVTTLYGTLTGSTDSTVHINKVIANDVHVSGSIGIGTSNPLAEPDEKNDLVIGDHTGNRGMTIASVNTGIGTIRFSPYTSANNGEGWIDYSGNTNKMRFGTNGLNTRMTIGAAGKVGIGVGDPDAHLEVMGTGTNMKLSYDGSNFTAFDVYSGGTFKITPSGGDTTLESNVILGNNNSGTGSNRVTTFYNTLTGANGAGGGGDIHADKIFANDIYLSGTATGITATFVSGTTLDPRSYSYLGWETSGYVKASGSMNIGGTATIGGSVTIGTTGGASLIMPDNTSTKILVADGNSFQEVQVTGDVTIAAGGAVTIAADAVHSTMLNDDCISGFSNIGAIPDQADEFLISDAGTLKAITFDQLENSVFAHISGDATAAAGGALTIAAAAVEHGMLNDNIISGQTELAHADIADADDMLISDATSSDEVKRVGVDSLRDHFFGAVSGDATVADGGALTIANDAVEQAMIADDAVGADQLASNAVVNASIVDGTINVGKLDIDGSTDIGAPLQNADLIIVDDGAGGTNRKAALSRILGYTKTDVSTMGVAEASKAIILDANASVVSGLQNITGSKDLYFKDIKASSGLHSEGDLFVSGSVTLGTGSADTITIAGTLGALTGSGEIHANKFVGNDVASSGSVTVGTLLDVGGLFKMPLTGSGLILVADGTSFQEVAISGDIGIASNGAVTIANDAVEQAMIADDAVGADQLAPSAVVNASIVDGTINVDKLDIDGSTDIGGALVGTDLIIVDDGASGTNRKAALSRVATYTKTDVGSVGTVEGNKAIIVDGNANINSGLASVTGSATLLFTDVQAETSIQSRGSLGVSGSTTLAAGLSSSMGLAIPDNEILRIGNGNDLKVFHNATNTLFVNQTGHMRFDNQATGKHIQMDLGADDATTQFQVRNNSGTGLLVADGVGMQVTGTLEVSSNANFTAATSHEAGLISTTMSGSGNLSAHGSAHIGGTLTMDGAGIVFNVASSAGTVNLQVNDGAGADTAITLGKNGKVTKIGDDTPTDGQYLSWDASGGKVAWSDGTTPDMSGSDNHYSSTEIRTSGDLKVSGSITFGAGATLSGSAAGPGSYLVLDANNQVKIDTGGGSSWVLEDDDGTEVTVSSNQEVKFIGSGITTNWTDTDNGTDADPYDLTFTVDAAQTGITSLFATDIKIGEDDQTKIDFETADEIHFYAANAHEVTLAANTLKPAAADGCALGAATAEWSDLYLADEGIIYLGNDQDVHLMHDPDSGLIVKRTATGDNNPTNITIQTGETAISAGNVLGRLQWQAPDESNGTDASSMAASIECRASASWNADVQQSSLVFNTAENGTLTPWMELEYDGNLTGSNWEVNQHGTGSFSELNLWGRIMSTQDTGDDTYIDMRPGYIAFAANTGNQPQFVVTLTEVVVNEGSSGAQDFRVESNGNTHAFFVDSTDNTAQIKFAGGFGDTGVSIGSTGSMNLDGHVMATGDLVTSADLHVLDDAFISGDLTVTGDIIASSATPEFSTVAVASDIVHAADADTKISFTTDQIDFIAGGRTMLTLDETTQDIIHFNSGNQDIDFVVSTSVSSGSFKIDGATGDIHLGGEQIVYDHSDCALRIYPNDTTSQAKILLHSRDTTAADEAALQFLRYTDGSLAEGDNLGIILFKGSEDVDGTYYTAAAIDAEVDEASWIDGTSTAGRLRFWTTPDGSTTATEKMRITQEGYVGIGNLSPDRKLNVNENAGSAYIAQFRQESSTGYGIRIRNADDSSGRHVTFSNDDGTNGGHITMNGTTVTYGAFTGYHPAALPAADHDTGYEYGTIVKIASVDSTTYEKSVTYNVEKTTAAQDKAALGVWAGKMSECFNDDGSADRESGMHQIFSVGDGHILVCSEGGNIETGDFICSSNTEGYGMLQSDDLLHNYTVARASEPVDWSAEGSNTKLIACTYHAG